MLICPIHNVSLQGPGSGTLLSLPWGCGSKCHHRVTQSQTPGDCPHLPWVLLPCKATAWRLGQKAILTVKPPQKKHFNFAVCTVCPSREAHECPQVPMAAMEHRDPVPPSPALSPPVGEHSAGCRGGGCTRSRVGAAAGAGPDESLL